MKHFLLIILILYSFSASSQVSSTRVVRIANPLTAFGDPLSEGNIVIDLQTDLCYLMLTGIAGTQSLSTLVEGTDYKLIASVTEIAGYTDTYWDDLQVNIASARLKPNSEPVWIPYKGGYVLSFDNNSTQELYFTAQLSHKYKHGSDISFHLHLIYPDNNAGNADWTFTYAWANINEAFPSETSVTTQTVSPASQDTHQIGSIAILPGTGKTGSSVLICSLKRNGSAANDTYNNSVYLISLDFHYQIDKPGSDNEIPD